MTQTSRRADASARRSWSALAALVVVMAVAGLLPSLAQALDPRILDSVVSVRPEWSGSSADRPEAAPGRLEQREGTAVAIRSGGYLVTALHVIGRAETISVRFRDGRLASATLVGRDPATDLAVLKIARDLPVPAFGPRPGLASPVCTVGNQFGLDLSVTCGVVSATSRSGVGFNPIEDFIQTDASVNPGASGGALVDREGRLLGVLSAIFTRESDADIGINFAVSLDLTLRVVDDLIRHGRVIRARSGLRVRDLTLEERRRDAGARVVRVTPDSAAARSGLVLGDLIVDIAGRPITKASEVTSALQLHRPGDTVALQVRRSDRSMTLQLQLAAP